MADKNVSIDIIAADRTRAAFESVKRGLGEVDSKLSMVKGTIGAFSALAATAGLTQLVNQAVQAAAKAEDSSARLDAVLRATGNTTGFTRAQLDLYADSLAKATTFDDEGIRDAMSTLTKFGRLHGDVFQKALQLSADYAAFTGGGLAEAAQAVGKALADPIQGAALLERQLGKLTAAQDASIRKFMEQGRISEAQAIVFNKLETSIGGTAGQMNAGLSGKLRGASKAWDELIEAIGKSRLVKTSTEAFLDGAIVRLEKMKQTVESGDWAATLLRIYGQVTPLGNLAQAIPNTTPRTTGPSASGDIAGADRRTAEERAAQERARAAEMQEAAQARMETIARRERELEAARAKARDEIAAESYKRWQDQMRAHMKRREELRQEELQAKDRFDAASLARYEVEQQRENQAMEQANALQEAVQRGREEEEERYAAFRDRLTEGLMSEQELLRFHYEQEFNMLNDANAKKYISNVQYYELMGRLVQKYERDHLALKMQTASRIEQIAMKAKNGELNAMADLFNTAVPLMQAKSRTLFEIGKAAAYASAVVNTAEAVTNALKVQPFPLGLALAGVAAAAGAVQIQAIRSTTFNGGGSSPGSVGTFAANPSTGLPESPTSSGFDAPVSPLAPQRSTRPMNVHIQFVGSGRYTQEEIRDSLVPALREAYADGVTVN